MTGPVPGQPCPHCGREDPREVWQRRMQQMTARTQLITSLKDEGLTTAELVDAVSGIRPVSEVLAARDERVKNAPQREEDSMFNPLKRAAELARQAAQDAGRIRAADVPAEDIFRAAEVRRLAELAERTRRAREAQREADELTARAAASRRGRDGAPHGGGPGSRAGERRVQRVGRSRRALARRRRPRTRPSAGCTRPRRRTTRSWCRRRPSCGRPVWPAAYKTRVRSSSSRPAARGTVSFSAAPGGHRLDPRLTVRQCLFGALRAVGDRTAEAERLRSRLDLVGRGLLPDLPAAFVAPVPAWRRRSLRRTGRR